MPIALRSAAAACLALAGSIAVFATTPQAAEVKVEADLSQTVLPTSKTGSVYLRLSLKSLAAAKRERDTRINTALVIDRSGPMVGDRIAAAKEGARVALERLSDDDTIALVAYNHEVQVLSDAARLGRSRDELASAIKQLRAGGTTRAPPRPQLPAPRRQPAARPAAPGLAAPPRRPVRAGRAPDRPAL